MYLGLRRHAHTQFQQACCGKGRQYVRGHQGFHIGFGILQIHRIVGRHAGLPQEGFEIVGHRTNHICRALKQIDFAVAVKIDGIFCPTGGHELWQPHGTGVTAAQAGGVDTGTAGQAQITLQLALEKGTALDRAPV